MNQNNGTFNPTQGGTTPSNAMVLYGTSGGGFVPNQQGQQPIFIAAPPPNQDGAQAFNGWATGNKPPLQCYNCRKLSFGGRRSEGSDWLVWKTWNQPWKPTVVKASNRADLGMKLSMELMYSTRPSRVTPIST